MINQSFWLPAATNKTTLINLPLAGGWNGGVVFSLFNASVQITLHNLQFIRDGLGQFGPVIYRTALESSYGGQFDGVVFPPGGYPYNIPVGLRPYWAAAQYESMVKIQYTCTQKVGVCIETSRAGTVSYYRTAAQL